METKIYFIEEHKETIFDSEKIEQWNQLVDELGLTKQKTLTEEKKSPLPFSVMSELQSTIWREILTWQQNYKEYDSEAIPIEILSVIALCEREKHFDLIEIWHSRELPDPIVVGKKYPTEEDRIKKYNWTMVPYLIASWGPKLKPAEQMLDAYDTKKREEFASQNEYNLKQHEEKMRKFRFQAQAYINNIN